MKTIDNEQRLEIAKIHNAGSAKRAGRNLDLRSDWEDVKFDIMVAISYLKYVADCFYQPALLGTGEAEIIEDAGKWDDCVWGIGKEGQGQILLGLALMRTRDMIRNGKRPDFSLLKC